MSHRLRSLAHLAPLLAGLCLSCPSRFAYAQAIRFRQDVPNCHVLAPRFDNPLSDTKGFTQRALYWDAEYAALSVVTAKALHRWTPLPSWAIAAVPSIGFGLAPHVRGYLRGSYPISLHWLQVAWDRSLPAFRTAKDSSALTVLWLAGEVPLSCFDR